jgi:hypothetical protein
MRINDFINCRDFPCPDIFSKNYLVPQIEISPEKIRLVMISESAPTDPRDYFYSGEDALFAKTTLLALQDAGVKAETIQELVDRGIYFTTAVKCSKTGYGIQTNTIAECSRLLEKELNLFPNSKVFMLMGDVAIRSINATARRSGEKAAIPASSTYKIRGQEFSWNHRRLFPSYLQAGPSFFIEKSKRKMIAEDISTALRLG